jgi:hypothetical protein
MLKLRTFETPAELNWYNAYLPTSRLNVQTVSKIPSALVQMHLHRLVIDEVQMVEKWNAKTPRWSNYILHIWCVLDHFPHHI